MKKNDTQKRPFHLSSIFGTYTPPPFIAQSIAWLKSGKLLSPVKILANAVKTRFLRNKTPFYAAGGFLLLLFVALISFNIWKALQPRLLEITYEITAPTPRTDPEETVSPLIIAFNGSAARTESADQPVTAGITLNPAVEGKWAWNADDRLIFTPSGEWPIGTKFKIIFAKDFFPDHVRIDLTGHFDTEDFKPFLSEATFYIDPENSKIKRVYASVHANYPIDAASIDKIVTIKPDMAVKSGSLEKRNYHFGITYDEKKYNAYIVSEPLGMPVKDVDFQITVGKGLRSSLGGSPTSSELFSRVTVPGASTYAKVDDFSHTLVKTPDQRYDQIIILATKGELDSEELAKNLIITMLPVDLPALPGLKEDKDHRWGSLAEIVPEVLKLSSPVKFDPIPNENKYSAVNSLRISAAPGRFVYVKLKSGTRFYGDYFLSKDFEAVFQVKEYPKEVSILSDGTILSMSGDKKLSMLSRGITDIEYNVGRIRPDDINHLVSQSNGDIAAFRFDNYYFNEYNLTAQYRSSEQIPLSGQNDVKYFSFDFSHYLDSIPSENLRYGLFIFTVHSKETIKSGNANDGDDEEDNEDGEETGRSYSDKRLIMVTDLGFLVKSNTDKTKDLFVQSIATGTPVSAATVSVIGMNGNTLISGETGPTGHISLPNLSGYVNEKKPVAYIVRKGEDLSFMPYSETGRILDYSSFNIGGVIGATDPATINAFLFSDRGVYRPGDEMRIGMMIKAGDWKINLERTPLECRIIDSNGAEVFTKQISLSREGLEEIRYATKEYSPTGEYTISLYVIREKEKNRRVFLGSETVKVEEFLPDTLTVQAAFSPLPQEGWIKPGKLDGLVNVRNLFGTNAAGNQVKAQISLSPGMQVFNKYRDFTFTDPYSEGNSYKEFLGTLETDKDGKCGFPINLVKFEPATYNLRFYVEAFEKGGGRKVSNETSVYVSPLDYLVGYKADGSLAYIQKDNKRTISFLSIGPDLQKKSVPNLTLSITEKRYVSILVKQPNGVYKYQSVQKDYPVKKETIQIPAAGLQYDLPSDQEGDFEILITGADGLVYNKIDYSIVGSKNIQRSLNRTAELEVKLDKTDFKAGDTIQVFIKAPYEGAGLITIERDRVYAHKWFVSNGLSSVQTIEVPSDIEGNGYISVTYIRSQSSKEIYMSPLSYAATPFSVSKESKTSKITLDFPEESKPGKDFAITYSTSKPGKIILFAVDEGILQVARYKTPNPLAFFFKKRALEVNTSQILDLILPEFSVVQSLAAMGGDGSSEELNRNLNPFKRKRNVPVAYWSGILDADQQKRTVHYTVPDYFNGTIRVMAVTVSDNAIGATEGKALIKNTFIITPNIPMMAAPGDEFKISVTVTNNQKGVGTAGKVTLTVKPSSNLTVLSEPKIDLAIPEGQDKTVDFTVRANKKPGDAELRLIAQNGTESSEQSCYLSVRPAVPYRVTLTTGVLRKNSASIPISRGVYEDFNTRDVSLSYLPLGLAKGLVFYLEKFPYGCSEQMTSAAYPLLYPELLKGLSMSGTEASDSVYRAISVLQARVRSDGMIGMWTSRSDYNPYIMSYCTQFLIEARNKGYYVSPSLIDGCIEALKTIAASEGTGAYELACRSYAIYVLTLNETITTSYIEKLKKDMKEDGGSDIGLCGLFLSGSYAMLKQDFDASVLLGKIKREYRKDESFMFIDPLYYNSLYLAMVARHFPARLKDISEAQLLSIAAELEKQDYTTLSASAALTAIDCYLAVTPSAETGNFSVSEFGKSDAKTVLTPTGDRIFSVPFSGNAKKLTVTNKDSFNLFYQITLAGFDLEPPAIETKQGIEVYREFTDMSGNKKTSFLIGDDVLVKLNVRSISSESVNDVALVDMLPAGFEADIDSIRNRGENEKWTPAYVDIREDRIVLFGSFTKKLATFTYKAHAVNSGTFTVPPLFAEAMYDKQTWAYKPQEPIVIKDK